MASKWSGRLIFAAFVCVCGSSLQFGYNLAVINAPAQILKEFFHDIKNFEAFLWPLAVAIYAIGGMFGAFIGPHIAKRIGRKKALIMNNLLVISGGVLLGLVKSTKSVELLIFARIVVGINAGVNTVVAPMYLSEIAPVEIRGSLGSMNQLGIVTGILIANVLGLTQLLGTSSGWPYLFAMTAIIGVVQLVLLFFCPESPRYLLSNKKDEFAATTSLQTLRGYEDVTAEINEMKEEAERESSIQSITVWELLTTRSYRRPLLISIMMQLAQQLSGIGGILGYSTSLFHSLGMPKEMSQAATCGVGALSVIFTMVAVVLVEVKGRRFLMLLGLAGMTVLYTIVTISIVYVQKSNGASWAKILAVISTLASVIAFMIGPGAIPWFIVAELFTQTSIAAAISIAGPTNWLGNFAVSLIYPIMQSNIHPYMFVPFIVLLVFFVLFTYFVVPETKGRTVAEIAAHMRGEDQPATPDGEKGSLLTTTNQ